MSFGSAHTRWTAAAQSSADTNETRPARASSIACLARRRSDNNQAPLAPIWISPGLLDFGLITDPLTAPSGLQIDILSYEFIVPEPGTDALLGIALAASALMLARRDAGRVARS